MFQACFKKVSGVCQEHFKNVSRVFFVGCFKEVSKEFQASFKVVSSGFQGSSNLVLWHLQGCFQCFSNMVKTIIKGVSRGFQTCFQEVFCCITLIANKVLFIFVH